MAILKDGFVKYWAFHTLMVLFVKRSDSELPSSDVISAVVCLSSLVRHARIHDILGTSDSPKSVA